MEENNVKGVEGQSGLRASLAEKDSQADVARQKNEARAKIRQIALEHIQSKYPGDNIVITEIRDEDYVALDTAIDYKAPSLRVSYTRTIQDEQGEIQKLQEQMIFLNEQGNIETEIAKIEHDGRIEITPEYREKLRNATRGAELVGENGEPYYIAKTAKTLQIREEKTIPEEREREEIAQSHRQKEGKEEQKDNAVVSVTEIDDPRAIARVLDLPLERVSGKYKLVRFRGNKFILVDDKNQVIEGLEISELAMDIQKELKIREGGVIRRKELEAATTEAR